MLRKIGFALAFSVLVASCGGDDDVSTEQSSTSTTESEDLAFADIVTKATLIDEGEPSGAPVTTVNVGRAGTAIYTGYLGTLGLDEEIAEPAAEQPTTYDDRHPLTGLGGEVKNRPAAIVKISNAPGDAPQSGLELADIVYEEPVEGGITRFAVAFQSQGGEVGPVRSGRTTDIGIFNSFGNPIYVYSGANTVTDSLLRKYDNIQNHSFDTTSGYYRNSSRRAPSNLYTDLLRHWASADGSSPKAQFDYRSADVSPEGQKVESFEVNYRANSITWNWDGEGYLRTQRGSAHNDVTGNQLRFENVVIVGTKVSATGMVDASLSSVPEYQFAGSGPAVVHTDGVKIEGTWTRPTLASAATLTTADGEIIELTQGRTWVQIVSETSPALQ